MRWIGLAVLSAACMSESDVDSTAWGDRSARMRDTASIPLQATNVVCPEGFIDLGLPHPDGLKTCVHPNATLLGRVDAGAFIGDGAFIGRHAIVGVDAIVHADGYVAERASVGPGAVIGARTVLSRRATVGAATLLGADSFLGRSATLGADVDASVGALTLGYDASLGDRCVVQDTGVILGSLAAVGEDCVIGGQVVVARGAQLGDGAVLDAAVVVGVNVLAGDGVRLGTATRLRKGVLLEDGVTVGAGVSIGRESVLEEDSTVGGSASLRSGVLVQARGTVAAGAVIRRGEVVAGNPLDPNPPIIAPGQIFSLDVPADPGTAIGQVLAADTEGMVTNFELLSGDPGSPSPYFAISSGGELTLTAAGADSLRDGTFTLGIEATDEAANAGAGTIQVRLDYAFVCEADAHWTGYADLVTGERVNLCVAYRATATSADRNTNVFLNPDVLTSCLMTSDFVEPFFRNESGNPSIGAVRYETSYTPPLQPGSNVTASRPTQRFYCNNAECTTTTLDSATSYNDSAVYVEDVDLCALSLDGYAHPTSGSVDHFRTSYQQYGSNARGLFNQNLGGIRRSVSTQSVTGYRAFRLRNAQHGSFYQAGAIAFLQRD